MPVASNTMSAKQLASLLILLAAICSCRSATFGSAANLTREAETLLQFKQGLTQAEEKLSRWTSANLAGVCGWQGVFCSNSTVTKLNFTDFNVSGQLTPPLCELPNLAELRIRSNSFTQPFPSFLLQSCKQLTVIDFSLNNFLGQLPVAISTNLSKLQVFNMEGNFFEGSIPPDLGNLSQLRLLRLRGNSLAGKFPPELGRLSLLQTLDLSYNPYDAQEIPSSFSNLSASLEELDLPGCQLIGEIPNFLGNFAQLWFISLSVNKLSGSIPASLANLHNLKELNLFSNQLSGPVPLYFNSTNFPHISNLQLHNNSLSGTIPTSLASLSSLTKLRLDQNLLNGKLPDALASLPSLDQFLVFSNNLIGSLSSDWGLHSTLSQFDVTSNHFTGSFPPHLCKGNGLLYLALGENNLTGEIPEEYSNCTSVLRFVANDNQLSGSVPSWLWTKPSIQLINLKNNNFSGQIILGNPDTASKPINLKSVFLDYNQFEGPLPSEIGQFWLSVGKLTMSQNKLSGSLPWGIGLLSNLQALDLSGNSISEEIPASIGNCSSLNSLDLSYNELSGRIPMQLGQPENLQYIDLSYNHLNGSIPTSLAKSTFSIFDVAYNDLSGAVPEQLGDFNMSNFEGNKNLCLPNYESCIGLKKDTNGKAHVQLLVPIVVLGTCAVLLCLALMMRMQRRRNKASLADDWTVVSFQKLGFNEDELYESLDEKNVIGRGGSGRVYKVLLDGGGEAVAVKKLTNCGRVMHTVPKVASPGLHVHKKDENSTFRAEMEILGKIKHRHIVKLMCSCSSRDAKLLVYEYVCNGSLGDVLHKSFRNELLCWGTRFQIAVGAAEGLAYLHHDCVPPVLHRDVKSNNILLDSSFQAKLADFGVAKLFQGGVPMTNVVGSVGYIAPEYAYTLRVDEKSDVYSYGVVLLELVTGRRPASKDLESEGIDLVKWVGQIAQSKEGLWKVFDCRLDAGEGDKESMLSMLKLGLLCTSVFPRQRPTMREVVELLRRATPVSTLPSCHHEDPFWDKTKHITLSIMT